MKILLDLWKEKKRLRRPETDLWTKCGLTAIPVCSKSANFRPAAPPESPISRRNQSVKPAFRHIDDFLTEPEANRFLTGFRQRIDWEQHSVKLFGREVDCPRLSAWYGDAEAIYAYSGATYQPQPWTADLSELKGRVEETTGSSFNSVLLNRYRDGQDSMGWHSDDETELGPEPIIASVSLGAKRKMRFRLKSDHTITDEVWLNHGSLLVMHGVTQRDWHHSLPKTKRVQDERINLTFRRIVSGR